MKRYLLPLVALLAWACCNEAPKQKTDPVDYVSTLTGTLSKYEISTGNTYPAVAVPWGAHFWTPQTGRNGDGWTYRYDATHIRGLKQTHQPSPWINDYGAFSIMPVTIGPVFEENARASWFSHKAETATPYYYSIYLADHDERRNLRPRPMPPPSVSPIRKGSPTWWWMPLRAVMWNWPMPIPWWAIPCTTTEAWPRGSRTGSS